MGFGDSGFRDPGSSSSGSWSPRIGASDETFQSLGFKFPGLEGRDRGFTVMFSSFVGVMNGGRSILGLWVCKLQRIRRLRVLGFTV